MKPTCKAILLGGAATLMLPMPASAQTESQPATPTEQQAPATVEQAPDDGTQLEDIVVTADRTGTQAVQVGSFRGARQLDVPLTVSVIPRELLDQQQSASVLDALRNSAGVSVSQISSLVYSNLAIRGIDVENRGNYRLNGILPVINIVGLPLEDKERVEALKGASALYYGFTAPSGIINMVMKRPTETEKFGFKVNGSSRGAIGGAVDYGNSWGNGVFGARLNAAYSRIDAGIDNADGHRYLLAGAFDFKPTDTLTFNFDVERIYGKAGEPGIYRYATKPVQTVANPRPTVALPQFQRNSLNFGPGKWGYTEGEETNALLSARWKFTPRWELSASAGFSDFSRDRHFSYIDFGKPLPGGNYTLTVANSPQDKFLNRNIRAELAGVVPIGFIKNNILIGVSQNVRDRDNPNAVNLNFTQNLANPIQFAEVPFALPNYGANDARKTRINDVGYYIFDRISFGEYLDVLAGVRKSKYRESIRFNDVTAFKASPTSFSYGVVGKPTKWISVYGTFIEGLETTPSAPVTASNAGSPLPPTNSRQYEAGVKVEPKHGLLLQAAYFNIKRDAAYVNGSNLYVLDGKQVYKGLEISASGQVTQDLSIYASALFLDAKYTEGAPTTLTVNNAGVPVFDPITGSRQQTTTIVGNRVDNAPKNTVSVSAEYKLTSILPGFAVNGAVFHVGSRALNAANLAIVPGYTIFNLGAGYTTEISGADTSFRVNWENVGNKRYFGSAGADFVAQGIPTAIKFTIATGF
jgi:iron complex outermembrane receptor protein